MCDKKLRQLDAESPPDRVLRSAIIGCGQIAGGYDECLEPDDSVRTHAKAYQLQAATELVAVADQNDRRAHEFSVRWGAPAVYTDAAQMLAAVSPDLVSICSPEETHADLLELCLDSPSIKAVWCEKPLTTDVARSETIVQSYAERGPLLVVNYQRRWDSHMKRIKSALQRGELGTIQKVVVFYTKGVCHNGSHAVDLLIDWLGLPDEMIVFGSHVDFAADDPTVDARLLMGTVPVYLIGADATEYSIFEIQILGTLGRVNVTHSGCQTEWFQRQSVPQMPGYRELRSPGTVYETDASNTIAHALDETIKAILTGEPVRSTGETALATQRVCQKLATLATTDRPREMPLSSARVVVP